MKFKNAGKLARLRATLFFITFLLAFSCSKEEVSPDICIDGDCFAYFRAPFPKNSDGYYEVKLDYSNISDPYFHIYAYAKSTARRWWYGDHPVVEAEFKSDKNLRVRVADHLNYYESIPVVQETSIYLTGEGDILSGKRIIGPIPEFMVGDTLTINAEIFWDASMHSVLKNFSLKFIIK